MKRFLTLLAVVAVVGVLGSSTAFAGHEGPILTPNFPTVKEGQIYDRSLVIPRDDSRPTTDMPRPTKDDGTKSGVAGLATILPGLSLEGLSGFDADGTLAIGGISGMTSRGSAMMSPRERADREIRKLIRQLD